MDTAGRIVTEALRLWTIDCLTVPDAIRRACEVIPVSPAARQRAGLLVHAAVANRRARLEAAILVLAERLGGGPDLAQEIDAWVEAHRMIKRCKAGGREPSQVVRSAVVNIESAIAGRLGPDVWREFAPGFEVQ
jgi:hypothetical protein